MARVTLDIEGGSLPEVTATDETGQRVVWVVVVFAFTTVLMAAGVGFYKAPSGIFAHHRLPYYGTITATFVAGLAEAWVAAAIWSSDDPCRHRGVARLVLYASFVPLAVIAGLGGLSTLFIK